MANSKQARKRARQAIKRRAHNASLRSMMRTCLKHVLQAIEEKDQDSARSRMATAVSVLDKMASKGLIHKNKAGRLKSRMNAKLKALVTG